MLEIAGDCVIKASKMVIFGEFLDFRVNLWRAISRDCGRVKSSRFREEEAEELRLLVGAAPILSGTSVARSLI